MGLLHYNTMDGYTWLALSFASPDFKAYDELGRATRVKEQSAWVLKDMDEALQLDDSKDDAWAAIQLSFQMVDFSYKWYDDREVETIKLAEVFLERLGKQTAELQECYSDERRWVIHELAQLYFDQGVTLSKSGEEANVYIEKLMGMAVSVDTGFAEDNGGFDFFSEDYASLLWGRWVREYQKAEEKVWRECFRPRLLCQMNSLDDDDPMNVVVGMQNLATSLFHAGDSKNAAAILSVSFKPLEDAKLIGKDAGIGENEEQVIKLVSNNKLTGNDNAPQVIFDASSEHFHINGDAATVPEMVEDDTTLPSVALTKPTQVENGLSLNITDKGHGYCCNGCRRRSSEVAEIYFCEICQDINCCGDCLVLLHDRNIVPGLKQHCCNPLHTFYRAWPIAEETRGLAAEYLNGEVQLKREWLENLRAEWLNVV